METKEKGVNGQTETACIPTPPPIGWVKQLARMCDVCEATVTRAVRYRAAGEKAELVRAKYRELYLTNK